MSTEENPVSAQENVSPSISLNGPLVTIFQDPLYIPELSCTDCNRIFETQVKRGNHMYYHHNKKEGFACFYCNKMFRANHQRVRHESRKQSESAAVIFIS